MQYTLKIAAINGDIVPLYAVASAMAMRDATAGGTPFHKPMYDGRLPRYIRGLIEEVRLGRLKVCDQSGFPIAVDPNVEATSHFGYATRYIREPDWKALCRKTPPLNVLWEELQRDWQRLQPRGRPEPSWESLRSEWDKLPIAWPDSPDWEKRCELWEKLCQEISPVEPDFNHGNWSFAHLNLGPTEPDKDRPHITWFTQIHFLNHWAETRGDSFVISHEGVRWFDERGWHTTADQITQIQFNPTNSSESQTLRSCVDWKESARQIAIEIRTRSRKGLTLDRLAEQVFEEMTKRHAAGEPGMTGKGGKVPKADTIERHALHNLG